MLTIRKTKTEDLDAVMEIIEEARGTIAALGIDQWQNGSPNRSMVVDDVALGQGYCVESDGALIGTFALISAGEPTYSPIYDGAWGTPDVYADGSCAYLAIHRVAITVASRGQGVSTAMIRFAMLAAKEQGRCALRIDTHRGNVVMRRMLEKHGFVHRGVILLTTGEERVAYELLLD